MSNRFFRKREGNTRWDKEEGGEFGELGGKRNGLHLVNGLHSHSPFIHRAAQFASHSAIFTDVAHQWQLSNCPEINMSFSWSLTSNLGIPLMVRKHVWTCVRLCLCTRGIKSGAGPYWCGTKCHSLIRMNSPVWLWDRAPTHSRASMCVRWLIAFTLSLSFTHPISPSWTDRLYLSLTYPQGLWADVLAWTTQSESCYCLRTWTLPLTLPLSLCYSSVQCVHTLTFVSINQPLQILHGIWRWWWILTCWRTQLLIACCCIDLTCHPCQGTVTSWQNLFPVK